MLMYTYTYMYVYMCVCIYIYICAVIPHTALLSHSELPQGKFLHRDSPRLHQTENRGICTKQPSELHSSIHPLTMPHFLSLTLLHFSLHSLFCIYNRAHQKWIIHTHMLNWPIRIMQFHGSWAEWLSIRQNVLFHACTLLILCIWKGF